eukprot:13495106-Alexandrium_andersonii.AAC.1
MPGMRRIDDGYADFMMLSCTARLVRLRKGGGREMVTVPLGSGLDFSCVCASLLCSQDAEVAVRGEWGR